MSDDKIKLKIKCKSNNNNNDNNNDKNHTLPANMNLNILPYNEDFKYIIHIADIHIPLKLYNSRQIEYNTVFNNLYKAIKKIEDNKFIVIAGDLFQVKTTIEPETYMTARNFIKNLAELAPVIIIIGNHDMNETNYDRLDTITPVCVDIDNVHFLKLSGLYKMGNVVLSVSSLFDKHFIKRSDISIDMGLFPVYSIYHGTLNGSKTDLGHVLTSTRYKSVSDFDGYDAVLLGDIHKLQYLRENIAYSGSLIQQNYGERPENHGMLIWDIKTHNSTFVNIENSFVYINLIVDKGRLMNERDILPHSDKYLNIKCKLSNTTNHEYNIIEKYLKSTYNINGLTQENTTTFKTCQDNIIELPQHGTSLNTDIALVSDEIEDKTLLNDIIKLHKELYESNDTVYLSSYWNILDVKFKNMFIYGNDNENHIVFSNGVNNICSKNMTGKSSIVNILIFALYDKLQSQSSTSKMSIVHNGKMSGYIRLMIVCNGIKYIIEKRATKSHSKNDRQLDAVFKYDTNFYEIKWIDGIETEFKLNTTSIDAVKTIQTYVGTYDEFTSHNVISTRNNTSILSFSPSEKSQHFNTMFKTDIYEKCCADAKKQYKIYDDEYKSFNYKKEALSVEIAKLNVENIVEDNVELLSDIESYNISICRFDNELVELNNEKENINNTLNILNNKYTNITVPQYNRSELIVKCRDIEERLKSYNDKIDNSILENETVQSLEKYVKSLNKGIKQVEKTVCDYNSDLCIIRRKIENHLMLRPNIDLGTLTNNLTLDKHTLNTLNIKLNGLESTIKSSEDVSYTDSSLEELENGLKNTQIRLYKLSCNGANIDEQKLRILYDNICRELSVIDTTLFANIVEDEIISNIAIFNYRIIHNNSKLTILNKKKSIKPLSFDDDDDINDIDEKGINIIINNLDKDKQQLSQIPPLLPVDKTQYSELLVEKSNIIDKINELRYQAHNIDYTTVIRLLESLLFDGGDVGVGDNDNITISKKDVNNILVLIKNVANGIYSKIEDYEKLLFNISNSIKNIENNMDVNKRINELIINNKNIIEHNDNIDANINWLNIYIIKMNLDDLQKRQELYIRCSHYFELLRQYNSIKRTFEEYELYKILVDEMTMYRRGLNYISNIKCNNDISILNSEIVMYENKINSMESDIIWYDIYDKYNKELNEINMLINICINNDKLMADIAKYKEHIQILSLVGEKDRFVKYIKQWDIIDENNVFLVEIDYNKNRLKDINGKIKDTVVLLNDNKKYLDNVTKKYTENITKLNVYNDNINSVNKYNEECVVLSQKLKIYKEYDRLFKNTGIPLKVNNELFSLFQNMVNSIFTLYTGYTFKIDKTDNSKLVFYCVKNNIPINIERLSGFETFILNISINQSVLNISKSCRCGFLIVDESLDCIDVDGFNTKLPQIIMTIKRYYNSVVLISHRDIADDLVDKQLCIKYYNTYSTINC